MTASVDSRASFERASKAPDGRMRGPQVFWARVAWLLLVASIVIPWALTLPASFALYLYPCVNDCERTSPAAEALLHAGVSLELYAWIALNLTCLLMLVSLVLALILFWRRSDDWMALLVAAFLVVNASFVPPGAGAMALSIVTNLAWELSALLYVLPNLVFYAVYLLFPGKRFAPRWSWIFLILWLFFSTAVNGGPKELGWLPVLYPVFFGFAIAFQVYRYRRVSTPVERQQTKWAVFGLMISLLANQLFWLPSGLTPLGETLYMPISFLVYLLACLLVPVTFFIAIQRYRLYEIDRIINKALVYGLLTGILSAIFVGGVISLQALVRAVTGQDSPVALVASTLLIAGLFQPIRSRIQKTIDRRFYRAKYDAQKALATFNTTLRQEGSLNEVQERLVGIVNETMRPAHVSLWIASRPTEEPHTPSAALHRGEPSR